MENLSRSASVLHNLSFDCQRGSSAGSSLRSSGPKATFWYFEPVCLIRNKPQGFSTSHIVQGASWHVTRFTQERRISLTGNTIIKRWMLDAIFLIDRMSCMWLQHSQRRIYFSPPFNSHSVWKHANATPAKWLNWDVEKMWKLNCETALTPTGIPGIPSIPSIPGIRVCL